MNTFTRALAGTLMALVIALGAFSLLYATLNAALDASGVKGAAEGALRDNAAGIASATGMSEQEVDRAIDDLDISSWRMAELPAQATPRFSVQASYQGSSATITTYDDPSYISVDALGQHATLLVPESAQRRVAHLMQSAA